MDACKGLNQAINTASAGERVAFMRDGRGRIQDFTHMTKQLAQPGAIKQVRHATVHFNSGGTLSFPTWDGLRGSSPDAVYIPKSCNSEQMDEAIVATATGGTICLYA